MITQPTTVEELKQIFAEEFFNHTDKVSKISPGSVLNALSYGVAKIGQKTLKDIALIESHIFIDSAYGPYLDAIAVSKAVASRFSEQASTGYMRLVALPGTTYLAEEVVFSGKNGVQYRLEGDCTVEQPGFAYAKVKSATKGFAANVGALTLIRIQNAPAGHLFSINEYATQYGVDDEDDETFRQRIKASGNLLATSTEEKITQAFKLVNSNVLRIFYNGVNRNGKNEIAVLSQNGADFTEGEFSEMKQKAGKVFNLNEMRPFGQGTAAYIELVNVQWQPIDLALRAGIDPSYNLDLVRAELQIRLNKYLDYRYFTKAKVEWDDLLQIAKSTPGITYVPDTTFRPNFDIPVVRGKHPRMRGFNLYDLTGLLVRDAGNTLNPTYFPASVDAAFQASVLNDLTT